VEGIDRSDPSAFLGGTMKNTKLVLALALTSGLTLMGACSGSDEEAKSDGASGTAATSKGGSSSGGSSDGGTTSKGGSSSGGTTSGGTTSGGTTNSGGGEPGDTGAGGGDGMNPSECPVTAPTDGDACTVDVTLQDGGCEYSGTVCGCQEPFGGGPGGPGGGGEGAGDETEWVCFDGGGFGGAPGGPGGFGGAPGGNNPDCPATQPEQGAECEGTIFGCDYDQTTCNCPGFGQNADTWQCD
jgi:hypothetical protein